MHCYLEVFVKYGGVGENRKSPFWNKHFYNMTNRDWNFMWTISGKTLENKYTQ